MVSLCASTVVSSFARNSTRPGHHGTQACKSTCCAKGRCGTTASTSPPVVPGPSVCKRIAMASKYAGGNHQTHPLAQNCGDEFLHVECEKHVGKCRLPSSHDHQTWLPAACCSPGLPNLIQNALPQDTQMRSKKEPSLGPGFENSRAREFCREFLGEFSR